MLGSLILGSLGALALGNPRRRKKRGPRRDKYERQNLTGWENKLYAWNYLSLSNKWSTAHTPSIKLRARVAQYLRANDGARLYEVVHAFPDVHPGDVAFALNDIRNTSVGLKSCVRTGESAKAAQKEAESWLRPGPLTPGAAKAADNALRWQQNYTIKNKAYYWLRAQKKLARSKNPIDSWLRRLKEQADALTPSTVVKILPSMQRADPNGDWGSVEGDTGRLDTKDGVEYIRSVVDEWVQDQAATNPRAPFISHKDLLEAMRARRRLTPAQAAAKTERTAKKNPGEGRVFKVYIAHPGGRPRVPEWTGRAKDEADAFRKAKKSSAWLAALPPGSLTILR